ncbi:hypothetical protein [Polaribacter sp. SA4-12]|uniref:hypothetical protein n=1 Tax=Polaribacter sp. SA4-12 TaxID=1312072 RepID=UPI000B3CBB5C|nr:hypothetical protein [Polaribacter sp. SA4-12]ARV15353.1 hypothetical protein BTO07_09460 [Polaribacter sp. SA4-12]
MKNIILLLFTILIYTNSVKSQNNQNFKNDNWEQEIKRDDFGDFKNYYYTYLGIDKFNDEDIFIKVEKGAIAIFSAENSSTFIGFNKYEEPYNLKIKKGNSIYNAKTGFVSKTEKKPLLFGTSSNLYRLITNGNGQALSIVIYNNEGKKINSFDVFPFSPIFK